MPSMSTKQSQKRRIVAKYRSTCTCGTPVYPGDTIDYNPEFGETVGCQTCRFTGEDPSDGYDPDDLDLYPIFHSKW